MFATEILMALVVLLVCLAWYPCCCSEATYDCEWCDDTPPSTITVTLSGVSDGMCNCTVINDSYIVPMTGTCEWSAEYELDAGDGETMTLTITSGIVYTGTGTSSWYVNTLMESTCNVHRDGVNFNVEEPDSPYQFDCDATHNPPLIQWTSSLTGDPYICSGELTVACQIN